MLTESFIFQIPQIFHTGLESVFHHANIRPQFVVIGSASNQQGANSFQLRIKKYAIVKFQIKVKSNFQKNI